MTGSMSIAEKRLPQDGRIQVKIKKKPIDLRVSTIPTNHAPFSICRLGCSWPGIDRLDGSQLCQ